MQVELSETDISDLRFFVSVAVWIRSEQVMNEDSGIFTLMPNDLNSALPPVTLSNDMLNVLRARNDLDHGRMWWNRLNNLLKGTALEKKGPSWHKPEDVS